MIRRYEFSAAEVCILLGQKLVDEGKLEAAVHQLDIEVDRRGTVTLVVSPPKKGTGK